VDPDRIQGGIGRRLMEAGEGVMRVQGAPAVWLVVHQGNERAIPFYRALGCDVTGVAFHDFEDIRIEFRRMYKPFPQPPAPLA